MFFVFVFYLFELVHILFCFIGHKLYLWQQVCNDAEIRMDEEVDESHLTVGKVNCISIAEHCYLDSKCLFFVSLLEELRHDSLRPKLRHFKWPRWIADIGSMNQCLQETLLILTFKVSVSFTHFFVWFKIILYGGMLRHIGTQNIFDNLFSWFWFLLICELWKDIAVMLLILK